MGNDVYTYILLEGDSSQKEHFINYHKKYNENLELDIWDCEPFLKDKNKDFFTKKQDYTKTGGRFRHGKNSNNIDFISLESKYGFIEETITELSKYYNKLTIKLDYRDEDFEMGIGWLVVKNGKILGEDYISLKELKDNHSVITNNIVIEGILEEKQQFIEEIKNRFKIKIINNQIEVITYNEPYYYYFKDLQKKYKNLYLKLVYRDSFDKYYGYIIYDNGILICDNFIYLKQDPKYGHIQYFKYNSLTEYLKKINSV